MIDIFISAKKSTRLKEKNVYKHDMQSDWISQKNIGITAISKLKLGHHNN